MSAGRLLTIDDFERLPQDMVDYKELIDGELVDVSGNTPDHNMLRDNLVGLLRPLVRREKLGMVISEQDYDFLGNVHGPDVTFFGIGKQPLVQWDKRVQRFVPDLAVEIASQSDTYEGLLKKKKRYLDAGTQEVWLISIETREVWVFPKERIFVDSDRLATPLIPGFSITVDELFRED